MHAGATVIQSSPPVITDPSVTKNDFCVKLDYHSKTVLIMSDGDDRSIIEKNVNEAIAQNPDYFIFAVRSRIWYKASVARLQALCTAPVRFFTLPATQNIAEQNANEAQAANSIFNLIV